MLTAYADPDPTFAIMVINTCSLMVKGPGLSDIPNILTLGMNLAHARPIGNEISSDTNYFESEMVSEIECDDDLHFQR